MRRQPSNSAGSIIVLLIVLVNLVVIKQAYIGNGSWYFALVITVPLLVLAIANKTKKFIYSII